MPVAAAENRDDRGRHEMRYDDTWPVTCSHWGCAKSM